jgi:hypothetical protein
MITKFARLEFELFTKPSKSDFLPYISLFEKIFLELLEIILTNQSGIFELPPTGLKIFVHRAWDI